MEITSKPTQGLTRHFHITQGSVGRRRVKTNTGPEPEFRKVARGMGLLSYKISKRTSRESSKRGSNFLQTAIARAQVNISFHAVLCIEKLGLSLKSMTYNPSGPLGQPGRCHRGSTSLPGPLGRLAKESTPSVFFRDRKNLLLFSNRCHMSYVWFVFCAVETRTRGPAEAFAKLVNHLARDPGVHALVRCAFGRVGRMAQLPGLQRDRVICSWPSLRMRRTSH